MWLSQAWAWEQAHQTQIITVISTVAYLYANVASRPDHAQMTGWKAKWWKTVDLLCFLTREKVPGRFKGLFTSSPAMQPQPAATPTDVEIKDKDESKP
jgi:hypothetical protein